MRDAKAWDLQDAVIWVERPEEGKRLSAGDSGFQSGAKRTPAGRPSLKGLRSGLWSSLIWQI